MRIIVYFVSFYVLFVCKCVLLPPDDKPTAVNKYIIYHIITFILPGNEPHIFQSMFQSLKSIVSVNKANFLLLIYFVLIFISSS